MLVFEKRESKEYVKFGDDIDVVLIVKKFPDKSIKYDVRPDELEHDPNIPSKDNVGYASCKFTVVHIKR